jgi:photosystem II stability/assembly factor-like uncharacterized protein
MTAQLGKKVALLALLVSAHARANGAFPQVSQLVADPSDSAHLVLRSNFGLLTTRDRGQSWDLVCEAGLGYQNIEPPIAVLADGTTIVALPDGIARGSTSECEFGLATGVAAYVADVARVPNAPQQAVAVSVDIDASTSRVWHSVDAGESWAALGSELADLNAATLEVAGSANNVYVSGVSQADAVQGVLAHSVDGGQTWLRYDVPGVSKVSAPYIAAVADANTVYVRLSGSPGHLLVTHDGGIHFDAALDFAGPLDGFALSPDGKLALAAGRVDGVWRAPTNRLAFERLSCAHLRCLSWTSSGLFACADEFQAGFLVGESSDFGASFQARLHLSCVRGPLACDSGSSVARACNAAWPAISEQLGTDCEAAGAFMPSTQCPNAGSGANGGSGGGDAGGDDTGIFEPMAGAPPATAAAPRGGNSCAVSALRCGAGDWLWAIATLSALALRRRRAREGFCPCVAGAKFSAVQWPTLPASNGE